MNQEQNKPIKMIEEVGAISEEAWAKVNETTFNIHPDCKKLICEGTCKADCCGCVPMKERHWQQLKKLVRGKEFMLMPFRTPDGQKWVKAITPNYKCVFLNEENLCMIHKSPMRTSVCQVFGMSRTEPMLACPHINPDKKEMISQIADEKILQLANSGDAFAQNYVKRRNEAHENT